MKSENSGDTTHMPHRILIVEDVTNVATVLKSRLESFGYEICGVVKTGLKAIQRAISEQPDLILMDIILEGDMNGIAAASRITEQIDVPIIYLSCLNDRKIFNQALKTHPYGYILKPYDSNELRFGIENAIEMHRSILQRDAQIADLEKHDDDPDL